MIDHAQRIHLKHSDELAIAKMEHRASPLVWCVVIVLALVALDGALNAYANHVHSEKIKAANNFALCLNGQYIQLDDVNYVKCNIEKFDTVKGMK